MRKILLFYLVLSSVVLTIQAQNLEYANRVIQDLSSPKYYGRGYYRHGDNKAAKYIMKEYKRLDLKNWGTYFQEFSFPVNTQHKKQHVFLDGKELVPGYDFVAREYCTSFKDTYQIYYIDSLKPLQATIDEVIHLDSAKSFIAVDYFYYLKDTSLNQSLANCHFRNYIFIFNAPLKRYMAASGKVRHNRVLWMTKEVLVNKPKLLDVDFNAQFVDNHKTKNVIGYIEGSQQADSFFVFTAHFDHMGRFGGKTYYPGANDNLSGVAMLLNLAEYYSKPENKPAYSMVFIAFAGEETGLLGSYHYVENPCFPLGNIKYLINYDMIADNNPEVYVEMSEQAVQGFGLMETINQEAGFFNGFNKGDLSGNSDHYPFAEKGVPSVFFLDHGDAFRNYHTPFDTLNEQSLLLFPSFFTLSVEFVKRY